MVQAIHSTTSTRQDNGNLQTSLTAPLKKWDQAQLNQLAEWIGDGAMEVGGSAKFSVSSVF